MVIGMVIPIDETKMKSFHLVVKRMGFSRWTLLLLRVACALCLSAVAVRAIVFFFGPGNPKRWLDDDKIRFAIAWAERFEKERPSCGGESRWMHLGTGSFAAAWNEGRSPFCSVRKDVANDRFLFVALKRFRSFCVYGLPAKELANGTVGQSVWLYGADESCDPAEMVPVVVVNSSAGQVAIAISAPFVFLLFCAVSGRFVTWTNRIAGKPGRPVVFFAALNALEAFSIVAAGLIVVFSLFEFLFVILPEIRFVADFCA